MGAENVIWWKILLIFDCLLCKPFFFENRQKKEQFFLKNSIDKAYLVAYDCVGWISYIW